MRALGELLGPLLSTRTDGLGLAQRTRERPPTQPCAARCQVLLGWHNHSCRPNAAASVDDSGLLRVTALRRIASAEEVLISYVDVENDLETR